MTKFLRGICHEYMQNRGQIEEEKRYHVRPLRRSHLDFLALDRNPLDGGSTSERDAGHGD